MRIPFFLRSQNRRRQIVKGSIAAKIKCGRTLLNKHLCYCVEPFCHLFDLHDLRMTAKGYVHKNTPVPIILQIRRLVQVQGLIFAHLPI